MAFLQAPVENTSPFVVTLARDSTGSVVFFLSGTTSRAANLSLKRVRLNDTGLRCCGRLRILNFRSLAQVRSGV